MKQSTVNSRILIPLAAAALILSAAGCAKKTVAKSTPPTPQATPQAAPATPQTAPPQRPTPQPQQTAAATPPSRYPDAATRARIDQLLARIEDAYFDYNQHSLRPDAMKALQADSTELRDILVQYS